MGSGERVCNRRRASARHGSAFLDDIPRLVGRGTDHAAYFHRRLCCADGDDHTHPAPTFAFGIDSSQQPPQPQGPDKAAQAAPAFPGALVHYRAIFFDHDRDYRRTQLFNHRWNRQLGDQRICDSPRRYSVRRPEMGGSPDHLPPKHSPHHRPVSPCGRGYFAGLEIDLRVDHAFLDVRMLRSMAPSKCS